MLSYESKSSIKKGRMTVTSVTTVTEAERVTPVTPVTGVTPVTFCYTSIDSR
jgi:hypothetical protein